MATARSAAPSSTPPTPPVPNAPAAREGRRGGPRHAMRGPGREGRERGPVMISEVAAKLGERFDGMDANHDGVISPDERRAAMTAHRADRQARRAERQAARPGATSRFPGSGFGVRTVSGSAVMDESVPVVSSGRGRLGRHRRPRRGTGAPRGSGRPGGVAGVGRQKAATHSGLGAADAGRRGRGRGRGAGGHAQSLATSPQVAARPGPVRHLAAPGGAEPLLRPAEAPARNPDRRAAGSTGRRAGAGSGALGPPRPARGLRRP